MADRTKESFNQMLNVERLTYQEVGDRLGVSRQRAWQIMQELGAEKIHQDKPRPSPLDQVRDDQIETEYVWEAMPESEIAARHNCPIIRVVERTKRQGLRTWIHQEFRQFVRHGRGHPLLYDRLYLIQQRFIEKQSVASIAARLGVDSMTVYRVLRRQGLRVCKKC